MSLTNFPNGITSFGVPVVAGSERSGTGSMFGKNYFVHAGGAGASDGNSGLSVTQPFSTLQKALNTVGKNDTIFLAPGNYSADNQGPINATAPFCSLMGVQAVDLGTGPFMTSSTSSVAALEMRARGWRVSGIEFDNPTGNGGIRLTKSTTGGVNRGPDFFQVDNCLFSRGQAGIIFAGGGTYWRILNNQFSLITTAGKAGIYFESSGNQVPALGWIKGNSFDNTTNHIDGQGSQGPHDTVIQGNNFTADGAGANTTVMFDIRSAGDQGGNSVIGNYIDLAAAVFDDDAAILRANSTDYGAGNQFNDVPQTVVMSA